MMTHGHTRQEIEARLEKPPEQSYLRDWVYGGVDGAVTTFAVVSGVVGAELATRVILILGAANLFADGFSMAAANFLGTKAEQDEYAFYKAYEEKQVERVPADEREEVRVIFRRKGFHGAHLDRIVEQITSDRKLWVDTMMREEYGLAASIRSPLKAAVNTFIAFFVCGLVSLLPYFFKTRQAFLLACLLTGVVFFLIGSLKSCWSIQQWWRSGLVTLGVGSVAASLAYLVGYFFHLYSVGPSF